MDSLNLKTKELEIVTENQVLHESLIESENILPEKNLPETDKKNISDNFLLSLYNHEEFESSLLATQSYILTEEGWNPSDIGTWNPVTRIATLIKEVNKSIEIQTDCVLLTGSGCGDSMYTIDGSINNISFGILSNGHDNITIRNVKIINCPSGIRIYNSDNILIKENIFINNSSQGIFIDSMRNATISSNEFVDSNIGIHVYSNSTNITIEKNLIKNSSTGIYLNSNVNSSKVRNNTVIKNNDFFMFYGIYTYSNSSFNSIENNKIIIQNADISNATIIITGIYFGSTSFSSALNNKVLIENNKLQGIKTNSNITICGIQFPNSICGNVICKYNSVSISQNSIYCKDFSLYTNIYLIYLTPGDIGLYTCEYNKLYAENNNISSVSDATITLQTYIYGIYIGNWNGGTAINNNLMKIFKNSISYTKASATCKLYGFYMSNYNTGTSFENNSIILSSNTLPDLGYCFAIYFSSSNSGNIISTNNIVILNNVSKYIYGICFNQSNNSNKIQYNTLSNNQGSAIYFVTSNNSNLIDGNELCKNQISGIYFSLLNLGNTIQNNCINNNLQNGIQFDDRNTGNNIIKNGISNNSNNGIYFHINNTTNRIYQNSILYNKINGILFDSNNNENKIEYNEVCYSGESNINNL